MRRVIGDFWSVEADAHVIPSACRVSLTGHLIMGSGVAAEALRFTEGLDKALGIGLGISKPNVGEVFATPFKTSVSSWIIVLRTESGLFRGLNEIDKVGHNLISITDELGLRSVVIPKLTAIGDFDSLSWTEVRDRLGEILDDRFLIVENSSARTL